MSQRLFSQPNSKNRRDFTLRRVALRSLQQLFNLTKSLKFFVFPILKRRQNGFGKRSEAVKYNNSGHKKYLDVDFDDAIADYSKAIDLDPTLAVAYYNRGTVLYRLGNYEAALADLTRSVDLEPGNPEFLEGLKECEKLCHQM